MIPYILLLLIPLLMQSLMKASNTSIRLSNGYVVSWEIIAQPVFITIFCLLLVLRYKYLGTDLKNYNVIFNAYGILSLKAVFSELRECLFRLYCWIFYNFISKNYQLFISATAMVSVLPIAYVYNHDKSHGYMKATIFVNMPIFVMLFSGIRQGLSISVGIIAYQVLKEKKNFLFILFSIIATLIHHTGFMVFLFLPLYYLRLNKKSIVWIVIVVAVVYFYNAQIFNFLTSFATDIFNDNTYSSEVEETGAYMSFVLFALFSVFCYVVEDESQMDEEAYGLRNILTFSMIIQMFSFVNPLSMRMNYYFIILIPLSMGKCFNCVKPAMRQVAQAAEIIISIYLTFYFFFTTYISYITGVSTLDTIPYVPFWHK